MVSNFSVIPFLSIPIRIVFDAVTPSVYTTPIETVAETMSN